MLWFSWYLLTLALLCLHKKLFSKITITAIVLLAHKMEYHLKTTCLLLGKGNLACIVIYFCSKKNPTKQEEKLFKIALTNFLVKEGVLQIIPDPLEREVELRCGTGTGYLKKQCFNALFPCHFKLLFNSLALFFLWMVTSL